MDKNILEVVVFKLNDSVTTDAFLTEVENTRAFVSSLRGFIGRHTAKNEDDLWIDIVKWQDMQSAKEAVKQFEKAEEVKGFVMMINHATVKKQLFEVENAMCKTCETDVQKD